MNHFSPEWFVKLEALARQCTLEPVPKYENRLLVRKPRSLFKIRWRGPVFAELSVYKFNDHWRVLVTFTRKYDDTILGAYYWPDDREKLAPAAFVIEKFNLAQKTFEACESAEIPVFRDRIENVVNIAYKQFCSSKQDGETDR